MFLAPLATQLLLQGLAPGLLDLLLGRIDDGAAAVVQSQLFAAAAQPLLPKGGQGFQPPQGAVAAAMQSRAHQGHLLVEDIQQGLPLPGRQASAQQLAALALQAPEATQQGSVGGLQLQHHAVEPLAPLGWLPPHEIEIEGAEAHTAQRANQVELPLQRFAVAQGRPTTAAAQLQFPAVPLVIPGPQPAGVAAVSDQVAVVAAAVRTQAGEQLHRFEQIRLPLAVAADDKKTRFRQLQLEAGDVAEVQQLQALQPDGSGAVES